MIWLSSSQLQLYRSRSDFCEPSMRLPSCVYTSLADSVEFCLQSAWNWSTRSASVKTCFSARVQLECISTDRERAEELSLKLVAAVTGQLLHLGARKALLQCFRRVQRIHLLLEHLDACRLFARALERRLTALLFLHLGLQSARAAVLGKVRFEHTAKIAAGVVLSCCQAEVGSQVHVRPCASRRRAGCS